MLRRPVALARQGAQRRDPAGRVGDALLSLRPPKRNCWRISPPHVASTSRPHARRGADCAHSAANQARPVLGHRGDFYTRANIIGITGPVHELPSVYRGAEGGVSGEGVGALLARNGRCLSEARSGLRFRAREIFPTVTFSAGSAGWVGAPAGCRHTKSTTKRAKPSTIQSRLGASLADESPGMNRSSN